MIAEGNPKDLVDSVEGKIWKMFIDKSEIDQIRADHKVISTQLKEGKTLIHVFSENQPSGEFKPSAADLEDVYFSRISEKMDVVTI